MKRPSIFYDKIYYCSLAILFTCWNGSLVDTSKDKNKRPDINFYGEVTDYSSTCSVEDILIGGKYEQIPFYSPIKTEQESKQDLNKKIEIDPKQNKIFIDLQDVSVIEPKYTNRPIEHEITINNKNMLKL